MSAPSHPLSESESRLLEALGQRLRLARRRRRETAQRVAAQAGITRMTLRRAEAGEPSVSLGTYTRILNTLGLAQDLVLIARDDVPGRRLQDEGLDHRNDRAKAQDWVRLRDYPLLREISWSFDPDASISPAEALALYERNWRHLERDAMTRKERDLLERLVASVGNGVLLV